MCAIWRKGYCENVIIDTLKSQVTLSIGDKIGSHDINYLFSTRPVLRSAIELNGEIPARFQEKIIGTGLRAALDANRLESGYLIQQISKAESHYLRTLKSRFVLATTVSICPTQVARRFNMDGIKLVLRAKMPRGFSRPEAEERASNLLNSKLPDGYTILLAYCEGRNAEEAAESAIRTLGLIVGVWNYLLTWNTRSLSRHPLSTLSEVSLGPLHTIHQPNGTIASDLIWYEPSFRSPTNVYTKDPKKLVDGFTKMRRRISAAIQALTIKHAFEIYADALAETRPDVTILKLWSVLEVLTDTLHTKYDSTIRRAAFVHSNASFAAQELHHLRELRNGLAHSKIDTKSDPNAHVDRLKYYVDALFNFSLTDKAIKMSRKEINDFLDLSIVANELQKRRALLDSAITFRSQ